ncbi:hypothetical protein TNCV_4177351 [Trichonephila clavipes]|nr:hypothetical protein TNCV_4177351 [Trichonephila clavipes]
MNLAMEQKKDQDAVRHEEQLIKTEEFRFYRRYPLQEEFLIRWKVVVASHSKHLRADILRHFHDAPPQDTLVSLGSWMNPRSFF